MPGGGALLPEVRHIGVRAARDANEVALDCPNTQLP
jgi:hypothetical protein